MFNLQDVNQKVANTNNSKKIFIVDDIAESCNVLVEALRDDYQCSSTQDSSIAIEMIRKNKPDLVILDYQMPGIMGVDICKVIRSTESTKYLPVVFVSGVASFEEKIKAFEMGADDFISKPFHLRELQMRLRRFTHRDVEPSAEIKAANLKMNLFSRRVFVDGIESQLTPKQFDILKLLVTNKNNIVRRDTFLKEIWGSIEVTSRNVDS